MASLVRRGLTEEGHAADVAPSGEDALWMAEAHPYDAIVLDLMLPGLDGFETCRAAAQGRRLGARPDADGARLGRRSGCRSRRWRGRLPDEALLVRRAARTAAGARPPRRRRATGRARRSATSGSTPPARRVWRGETEIQLSPKEFALLETFMRRPGQALTPAPADRARLGLRVREPFERRSTSTSATSARRSTGPSGASSLETVRGVGLQAAEDTMSRVPIRIRLTLFFAVAMAIVLAAVGAVRLRAGRDPTSTRSSTRTSAPARRTSSALVEHGGSLRAMAAARRAPSEAFAEDRSRPAAASSTRRRRSAQRPPASSRARDEPQEGPTFVEPLLDPGLDEPAGCSPCRCSGRGAGRAARPVEHRNETLDEPPGSVSDRWAGGAAAGVARRLPAGRSSVAARSRQCADVQRRSRPSSLRRAAARAAAQTTRSHGSAGH